MSQLSGVMVPITTPFDDRTGDIDAVALRNNARRLLDAGLSGILAAGSTGEAAMLDPAEFRQCVEWLRDVIPDDKHLMAGTGRESTRGTIAACKAASEAGADSVLVRAPGYYSASLTDASLVEHFRAVADASPVPVLLYNIPKYTHIALSDAVLKSLVQHQNILGAKDSSGDFKNFIAYRDAVPNWAMFVGNGALLYPALEAGGMGGILGVANFAADTAAGIAKAFAVGERQTAGALQERLAPLHKEIVAQLGPAGIKAAMDHVGLRGGKVRPPLPNLDTTTLATIEKLLSRSNLIAT